MFPLCSLSPKKAFISLTSFDEKIIHIYLGGNPNYFPLFISLISYLQWIDIEKGCNAEKEYNKTIIKLGNFSMECYERQDEDKHQKRISVTCDVIAECVMIKNQLSFIHQ